MSNLYKLDPVETSSVKYPKDTPVVNSVENAETVMLDISDAEEPHPDTPVKMRTHEDAEIAAIQDRLLRKRSVLPSLEAPGSLMTKGEVNGFKEKLRQIKVVPDQEAAASEYKKAAANRELHARLREREIPHEENLRAVVLDPNPPQTEALMAFRRVFAWRRDRRVGCVFVLGGSVGRGKTSALAWVLLRCKVSACYVRAARVVRVPHNQFSENREIWELWERVPVLGIDDLGTEGGDTQVLLELLWQRYDDGLCTLVTTNLARGAIVERYFHSEVGQRLADRLSNAQGCAVGDRSPGPGGLHWYESVIGPSLRNSSVRGALRREVDE